MSEDQGLTAKEAMRLLKEKRRRQLLPSRAYGVLALVFWGLAYLYTQKVEEFDLMPLFLVVAGLAAALYSALRS